MNRKSKLEEMFRPYSPWIPENLDFPEKYAKEWLSYNINDRVEELTVEESNHIHVIILNVKDVWNHYHEQDIIDSVADILSEYGEKIFGIEINKLNKQNECIKIYVD